MARITPLLLTLLVATAPLALAGEDDSDEDDRDDRSEGERSVRVEATGTSAVIKLKREAGGVEDSVKIAYDAAEGVMKIAHESENATAETESSLKVEFREVVEYRDANANGAFDPKVDEVVARYRVDEDLEWRLTGPLDVTSDAGAAGQRLVGTGAFPAGGALAFTMSVFGDFTAVNGTSLAPTDAKIDIVLTDFPYRENGTAAALLLKVEREAKAESAHDGDDDDAVTGVRATAGGITAYFTWAEEALVDGVTLPVRTTVVESEAESDSEGSEVEEKFYFSYPRGASVVHDPVLGLQSAETKPAARVPAPAAALLVAAVAGAALLASARRR